MPNPKMSHVSRFSGKGHVYIIDDMDNPANAATKPSGRAGVMQRTRSGHLQNVLLVRKFFKHYTKYEVHSVKFTADFKKADFHTYFKTQLKALTTNDFVIIYYHGLAWNKGVNWTWNYGAGEHAGSLNAFKFIQLLNSSRTDTLVIADCEIHTRFDKTLWRRKNGRTTEIITAGTSVKNSNGRSIDDGAFTDNLFFTLKTYADTIVGETERMTNKRKMRSVSQIMATNEDLADNPVPIFIEKTRKGDERIVRRFVILPRQVKKTKMIKFFARQIQGPVGGPADNGEIDFPDDDEDDADDDDMSIAVFSDDEGLGSEPEDDDEDEDGDEGDGQADQDEQVELITENEETGIDYGDGENEDPTLSSLFV